MGQVRASIEFREPRKRYVYKGKMTEADILNLFPLYVRWYEQNPKKILPRGWIVRNLAQLDADFLIGDQTGEGRQFLSHFKREKDKIGWYANCFGKYRCLVKKHGVIRPCCNSGPKGHPTTRDPAKLRTHSQKKMATDPSYAHSQRIKMAKVNARTKQELAAQHKAKLENYVQNCDNELLNRFNGNITDLAHYLLHCPVEYLPKSESKFAATSLPGGAKSIHEYIEKSLLQNPYFHGHFNTTSRLDSQGEWHGYLTDSSRNYIFAKPGPGKGVNLKSSELCDLKFIPVFRYVGNKANGFDRILIELETQLQTPYHLKAPVGTLGFRYNKAGVPSLKDKRVCTVYFVFSESELLQKVEQGELQVNPTKVCNGTKHMNHKVWDRKTWAPNRLAPNTVPCPAMPTSVSCDFMPKESITMTGVTDDRFPFLFDAHEMNLLEEEMKSVSSADASAVSKAATDEEDTMTIDPLFFLLCRDSGCDGNLE